MADISDEELVAKHINGDSQALDVLIRRYFKQVFFFAKTYVKQDMEAEDVTQETFVKLWKSIKQFDSDKKFKTWLFQIAKNTSIDFLRKHKNLMPAQNIDEEQMLFTMENMVDESPLPQELFDSRKFTEQFDEILNTLPESYKTAVVLHLQQELTFEEVSDIVHEPLNTVKSRYRRAMQKIKEIVVKKGENAPKSPYSTYN